MITQFVPTTIHGIKIVRAISYSFLEVFLCIQPALNHTFCFQGTNSALILIATWQREGPAMTQQFNTNHGHPDGDLLTSILACEWFLESKRHYNQKYTDWKTSWTREWNACSKVGLMHHGVGFSPIIDPTTYTKTHTYIYTHIYMHIIKLSGKPSLIIWGVIREAKFVFYIGCKNTIRQEFHQFFETKRVARKYFWFYSRGQVGVFMLQQSWPPW